MTVSAPARMTAAEAVQLETIVVRLRRQGRRLTLPVLVLLATAWAAGFWVGALPETWMNVLVAVAVTVVAVVLGVGPILAWLATRATITTQRVILRRGFFVQQRSEIALGRVREVRTRRGLVQRMFGSGDVQLYVGADSPFVIPDVPSPSVAVAALHELIEANYVAGAYPSAAPSVMTYAQSGSQ